MLLSRAELPSPHCSFSSCCALEADKISDTIAVEKIDELTVYFEFFLFKERIIRAFMKNIISIACID